MDTWGAMKSLTDERIKDAYQYADNRRLAKAAMQTQPSWIARLLRAFHPVTALAQIIRKLKPAERVSRGVVYHVE